MSDEQIQGMLPGLDDFYTGGPDFYQASSGKWWDMTTWAQWNKHLKKYGKNYGSKGTLLPTR
jgi:hypothetical protein